MDPEQLKALVCAAIDRQFDSNDTHVANYLSPAKLSQQFDITLGEEPNNTDLPTLIGEIQKLAVNTQTPMFCNQLFSSVDGVALAGEILSGVLNTSMYTFEVSSVLTLMEREIVQQLASLFGLSASSDGVFCPGASMVNLNAILIARNRALQDCKTQGVDNTSARLVGFTSERSHYSIIKAANIVGIGTANIVKIPCNSNGQMRTDLLDKAIYHAIYMGKRPFFVCATAGTTVQGAFDDFTEIATIIRKFPDHPIHLHIDGALGGSFIFSRKWRHFLQGSEHADTIVMNPHKLLGVPLQCTVLLTRESGILEETVSEPASYLFKERRLKEMDPTPEVQEELEEKQWDLGAKSIQCGRKSDALKFWLLWKVKGARHFEEKLDRNMEVAQYLTQRIRNSPHLELVCEPESNCVCFFPLPHTAQRVQAIRRRLQVDGRLLVSYQPVNGGAECFRICVNSLKLTEERVDEILNLILN